MESASHRGREGGEKERERGGILAHPRPGSYLQAEWEITDLVEVAVEADAEWVQVGLAPRGCKRVRRMAGVEGEWHSGWFPVP